MTSEVHIAACQANGSAGLSAEYDVRIRPARIAEAEPWEEIAPAPGDSTGTASMPEVIALGVDFVALPGKAAKLQTAILEAVRNTLGNRGGFSGCMVLVSEQEARLVTVLTLWRGRDRLEQCDKNSKRIKKLVTPYVDRFLRTRRLAAFLSPWECFPRGEQERETASS